MSAQRLGRARKLLMLHGRDGKHRVSGSSTWTKALGEAATIRAWLIFQCTKRLVPGISCAQANCGLQSPNGCTLRLCAVVRLSIAPVDDVGSTKIIWTLGTECSPLTLHEPHGRQTTMLAHQWRLLRFWCSYLQKGRRRRKHIRKNTWSVTMVVFVRKGRQDWRQRAITSENSYSFMIFDSQQLQGKFWLSRTLPSNFFDNMSWKNREWKAEGKWRQHSIWKKETRDTNLDISWLQANLAVLDTRGEHKERTKTNELLEKDGHGIAGRLDVSNTAKIQAKVAGHQFRLECCCYSGRTASCWVWTWNHTGAVPS